MRRRYILRNAATPIVAKLFLSIGGLMGSTLLVENVFAYPGVGTVLREAVRYRDYPLIQGVFLFSTVLVLAGMLISDRLCAGLDKGVAPCRVKRNRARWRPCLILCAGLLALTLFFGWGVLGWPCSPTQPSGASLEAPSAAHWLGTDDLGIDIYAQLSQGFFASMSLGLACGVLTALVGGGLGMLAGYKGGGVQAAVDFAVNVFLAVPQLPVLIVLGAFWGQDRRLVIG